MVELINTALMRTVMAAGRLRRRLSEERGQDLLEYALLSGVIAVGIGIMATILLGTGAFTDMGNAIAECIDFDSVCP